MEFGLPQYKKFPIDNLNNLKLSIEYFERCPEQFREELANNIYQASLREEYEIDENNFLFRYVNFNEGKYFDKDNSYSLKDFNLEKIKEEAEKRIEKNTKKGYKSIKINEAIKKDKSIINTYKFLKHFYNKDVYRSNIVKLSDNNEAYFIKRRTSNVIPSRNNTFISEIGLLFLKNNKVVCDFISLDESYLLSNKNSINEEFNFDALLGRTKETEILTEAPKNQKRKMIEDKIYLFFNTIDITGKNTAKYKEFFSKMSDEQFNKYMKKFLNDDNLNFYLEVLPNKNEPTLKLIKKCADLIKVPLDEYVYYRHDGDKDKPLRTAYRVPTGELILKRMQQTLSKKNTYSLSVSSRNMKTGTVSGHDKIARISDTESYSLAAIGADCALKEFLGPRADNMESKTELNKQISMYGYAYQKDLPENIEKSQAINTVAVYLMGAGLENDLLNKE